jgi:GNAT superfamily N-acetyltransferase
MEMTMKMHVEPPLLSGRYPVHMIDVVEVADGRRATVRPVLPQDAELLRAFFGALSKEARYFRFMGALRELPEALAERFSCIDYGRHMALLAEHFTGDRGTIIGEARYVVDEGDPGSCEFAIAVADDWQRLGLARTLLGRLESYATAASIRRMAADTMSANRAMLALATRTGFSVGSNPKDRRLLCLNKRLCRGVAPPARAARASPLTALADATSRDLEVGLRPHPNTSHTRTKETAMPKFVIESDVT